VPAFILVRHYGSPSDMITGGWLIQLFYVFFSLLYIRLGTKFGEVGPFLFDELRELKQQVSKGGSLALSSFLLIVLYSHVILRHKAIFP
jgi:formate hydrogenlyase subunit 4